MSWFAFKLDFIRPFEGTNDVELKIEPQGDETKLTWSMAGKNNFMAKAIGLVMDCEKMCGDQFEQGLANMKAIVEAEPAKPDTKRAATAERYVSGELTDATCLSTT